MSRHVQKDLLSATDMAEILICLWAGGINANVAEMTLLFNNGYFIHFLFS